MPNDFAVGFLIAAIIGIVAHRLRALTWSGALAAVIVGGIIFGAGGLRPSLALIGFFVSGSALTQLPRKGGLTVEEKAGRDWRQVAANGVIPCAALIVFELSGRHSLWPLMFFYGAIATAASDTVATEIGTRYGTVIRDILTLKPMSVPMSGGVSYAGLVASALGALFIGFIAFLPVGKSPIVFQLSHSLLIGLAGFVGSLADSVLGSALQGKYQCSSSGRIVESPNACQGKVTLVQGVPWLTNNRVNFAALAIGGLFCALVLDFAS